MFAIVLFQPEIPPNTGNIIRLAANTGCALHLIQPLGFRLDEKSLRRAGLDYHEFAPVVVHPDWADCRMTLAARRWWAFSTKATRSFAEVGYQPGDVLVFGPETRGLPQDILSGFAPEARLRVPMRPGNRSLNLSNSVAVAVFEAWRQNGFAGAAP